MIERSQLALAVQLPDDETFDSFQSRQNQQVVSQLKQFILATDASQGFYLSGPRGAGKSHLLHACCAQATELGLSSVCLSFSEIGQLSVEVLDGLETMDLVCLDDIPIINQLPEKESLQWQRALFDLFNRMFEHNKKLVMTGAINAPNLVFSLADLQSRLRWGESASLKALTDEDKQVIIKLRAKHRGLIITDDVCRFLLNHFTRDMNSLIKTLDILDKASIQEQRKITIPFIKGVL